MIMTVEILKLSIFFLIHCRKTLKKKEKERKETQGDGDHLQAKEKGFRRNKPC